MMDFASHTWQFLLVVINVSAFTNKVKISNTENRSSQVKKLFSCQWILILPCASACWKWKQTGHFDRGLTFYGWFYTFDSMKIGGLINED